MQVCERERTHVTVQGLLRLLLNSIVFLFIVERLHNCSVDSIIINSLPAESACEWLECPILGVD